MSDTNKAAQRLQKVLEKQLGRELTEVERLIYHSGFCDGTIFGCHQVTSLAMRPGKVDAPS